MPAKYHRTINPKPTEECPMPVIIRKDSGQTAISKARITDTTGHPMCYLGFLPLLRKDDGTIIDTLPHSTKLYSAVNGKVGIPDDGVYLPECPSSVDLMWKMAGFFPQAVILFSRPTRRHAWTLVK